ncbi:hypothetical protein Scep_009889 [Stephania cephalantha]|uniref:Uncharacterized protein n=1 Tax=Stephania cephalantha TaxID=152367 RepID=A0AAP0JVE4_9MAGN
MKYRYICKERRWIREEDTLDDEHYKGYESPYPIDPLVHFDELLYLDYCFFYPHGDDGDDEGHLLTARLARMIVPPVLLVELHLIRRSGKE